MRPLSPKVVLLLGALFLFVTAPLCVVADAMNGAIEHYKDQDSLGVLMQLPPPVDQVVKNLETIPIVSEHRRKPHGIPENLAPHESLVSHRSPVLAKGLRPSYTPHTLIRAKRAIETPDQFVPQTALPDIAPSSSTLPLDASDVLFRHFGDGLLWPRQLVWDPTLIQKPSSSAAPLSGDRLVTATPVASSPSKGTARVEKRDVKLSGSQYGGTPRPRAFSSSKGGPSSSPTRGAGGATAHLKPYMNRVFPQLPHLHSTRTWSTRTASPAATSKLPQRNGFHTHQLPFRPLPSSSPSPSLSRPSSHRPVLDTRRPAAADAAKQEKGTAGQWVAIGICALLVLAVILYLLIRGISSELKDGQRRRSAANDSNNNGGDGHALQSLRTSRPASAPANTNAAVPDDAKLPSTFMNPLRQNPPTPPRTSWQWGGMRSVGQVEEDRVDNPYTYPSAPWVDETRNPYPYPPASGHAPPVYPSLSHAKTTTDTTSKVPTTSSGRLALTTLSTPAPAAGGSVTRSSSSSSSSTLFDSSKDAHVRDMLASRNKKNRESWESWNKKCCQNEKERDVAEEQKDVDEKKKGASKFVPKWPGFRHEQKSCTV